jgi:hypothetical protein
MVRGDTQARKIEIRVKGPASKRRTLIGTIREYFDRIHADYEKLIVSSQVIVPAPVWTFVKYDSLLKYTRNGISKINVEIGDHVKEYEVRELLDSVDVLPAVDQRTLTARLLQALTPRLRVFISYSHKDSKFMDELRGALVNYERNGTLEIWADPLIEPGQDWEPKIFSNLLNAQIVLLLLSNDFFRSKYCIEKELEIAMARRAEGVCEIIPVVVRATPYDKSPIGNMQAILPNGKPVKNHRDRDAAWLAVTEQLDRVIARLKEAAFDRGADSALKKARSKS